MAGCNTKRGFRANHKFEIWIAADFSGGSESPASYANERQCQELHEEQGLGPYLVIAFVLVVAALFLYKCVAFLKAKISKNASKEEDVNDFVIAAKNVLDITQEKLFNHTLDNIPEEDEKDDPFYQDSKTAGLLGSGFACMIDIMEGIIGSRPRNDKSHQGLRQKETYGSSHFQRPSKRDLNWRVVKTGSDVSSTNMTETSGQRYRRRRYETSKRRNLAGIRAPVDWTALSSPRCQRQGQSDNFRSSYDREGEKRVRDDAGELSQGGRNKFQHVSNRIRSETYTAAQRSLNLR